MNNNVALPQKIMHLLMWACLAVILAWSWHGAEINFIGLFKNADNMGTLISDFFPPDFRLWRLYIDEILVTIQIAIWGTFLSIILSVPLGLMSSKNISPWWLVQITRRLMDACRAINEVVFAMIFVVAIGLGPFSGVLALFVHTTGVLAKLFSEAVESIEHGPVEGVRAAGANKIEEIIYGVIPQVMPLWVSYALYRFESNVRSATVLGIVGAGGIGVVLWESIRGFQFQETCTIIIFIILTVSFLDVVSQLLRKKYT